MRTFIVTSLTAAALLAIAPAASAQNVRFYEIKSASGTYDTSARYVSPTQPDCPGSYEFEEHADFRKRGSSSGGALTGGRGSLVHGVNGGYDGVYRYLSCGGVASTCEQHYGYQQDGGAQITITFTKRGLRARASLNKGNPRTDDCPLTGKNGFYLGRDRISRRERRRGDFTLRFRRTRVLREDGEAVGSLTTVYTAEVERTG